MDVALCFLSHAGLRSGDNKIGRMYTLRGHEWHFLIETMPEASQPVGFDASGIILIQCIMCGRDNHIYII
jgi:hypothetical protein